MNYNGVAVLYFHYWKVGEIVNVIYRKITNHLAFYHINSVKIIRVNPRTKRKNAL